MPTDAYVNEPAASAEATGPGTLIATMAVPWSLDFQCADSATCPTNEEVAACRHWLFYGGEGDPCAGIPRDSNFVALTLSGGGTRSAVLSAAIMFELQRLSILRSVDVISSVSGGSLTAALYAASCDPDADCQANVAQSDRVYWNEREILGMLRHNFMGDWAVSLLFNPVYVARYMTTYFNRNDVMADALADRLYTRSTGFFSANDGLTFAQLNPRRPNLILGATDVTTSPEEYGLPGRCFQFTLEHFQGPGASAIVSERNINSDLDRYPLAYAVMASNAFPGLFQYENLRDFSPSSDGRVRYVHLADGGIRDQVGLVPINSILKGMLSPDGTVADTCDVTRGEDDRSELTTIEADRRIILFIVDAANPPQGGDEFDPDARSGFLDNLPLGKALAAVDTIIDDQRALRGAEFAETRAKLTRALGGDPRCCRVIVFTVHNYLKRLGPRTRPEVYNYAIEQLDRELYKRITRDMPLGLNVAHRDLCVLRQTARTLVGRMSAELCRDGRLLDTGIACAPSSVLSDEYDCAEQP
ncbi:MAG TPA: patatin-like phospholipase family protein [Alphaproteobacteria bacterium]|nr:patatin-like phospholipase family protein [Alphaproteobacteria bacterium]